MSRKIFYGIHWKVKIVTSRCTHSASYNTHVHMSEFYLQVKLFPPSFACFLWQISGQCPESESYFSVRYVNQLLLCCDPQTSSISTLWDFSEMWSVRSAASPQTYLDWKLMSVGPGSHWVWTSPPSDLAQAWRAPAVSCFPSRRGKAGGRGWASIQGEVGLVRQPSWQAI